jgi:hypothetical protein
MPGTAFFKRVVVNLKTFATTPVLTVLKTNENTSF